MLPAYDGPMPTLAARVPSGRTGLFATFALGLVLALTAVHGAAADDLAAAQKLLRADAYDQRLKGLDLLKKSGPSDRAEKLAIKALTDTDWEVQIRATETLAVVGREVARKALTKHTYEGEIQVVRDAAIKALQGMDRGRCVARLLKIARKAKDMQKARALEAAGRLASPDDYKKLRPFAMDKTILGAAAGVRAVGRLVVHEDVRENVIKLLRDTLKLRKATKSFLAYAAAVEALAAADAPEACELLVEELLLLEDDDLYIQERIARGLARMKTETVEAALKNAVKRAKGDEPARRLARMVGRIKASGLRTDIEAWLGHRGERVRSESTRALGLLGNAASADALKVKLDDKHPIVQVEAVTALRHVLEPPAFRALTDAVLKLDGIDPRLQFVVELERMGDPEGIPALARFLDDENWRVATAASASVGTLGIAKDMPLLMPLTKHKDWRYRAAAFEGLGRLRASQAIPRLIEGLKDKDPVVMGVCWGNLQVLSGRSYAPKSKPWLRWWQKTGKTRVIVKRSRRSKEEIKKEEEKKKADSRYAKPTSRYAEQRKREIEIMQKARILVVTGAWDHVEIVLGHLKIRHTLLRAQELKQAGLNPNQIVLVNCEGNMDKRTRERVRWFVNVGGYLMSTDWALTKAVGRSFPGYMAQSAKANTGNDVVIVEEAAPGHDLTAGVFEGVAALKWWLEIQAFPIEIVYPERCTVLVDSAQMRQRYGTSPMAAVFNWGLGKVQHSVSHFFLQEEAMQHVREPRARMIFAADHLGLSLEQVRRMASYGQFSGQLTEKTMEEIAPDYSMFRMIVNMVREKSEWVEGL